MSSCSNNQTPSDYIYCVVFINFHDETGYFSFSLSIKEPHLFLYMPILLLAHILLSLSLFSKYN